MPLTQLNFQPGLDTENTPTGAESSVRSPRRVPSRPVRLRTDSILEGPEPFPVNAG